MSQIEKSGEAVKRLDRLAPNLAHICRSIWEWIYAKQIATRDTRGTWGFMGQTFKRLGKLSNGWTDWHQHWFMSADSSGNGHRLNPSRRSIPQGALGAGVGGHKFKSLGRLSNGYTDWHQLWYTSADSSGNGQRPNTISPTIPQGHWGGGLGGHKFQCFGKLSNGWTDWHNIWYKSADSTGNGNRLNTSRPSTPQGVLGGLKLKGLGKLSNN